MTISRRIFLGFLVLIVAYLVGASLAFYQSARSKALTEKVFANTQPSLSELENLNQLITESKMYSTNWIFLPAKSVEKRRLKDLHGHHIPKSKKNLRALSLQWKTSDRDMLDSICNQLDTLILEQKKIMNDLVAFSDYEDPFIRANAEYNLEEFVLPLSERILADVQVLLVLKLKELEADEELLLMTVRFDQYAIVFFTFILTLAGLIFSLYSSRKISAPIKNIAAVTALIGKGVITRVPDRKDRDELYEMTRAVNRLSDALREKVIFASEIGKGNLDSDFIPISDQDELGKALVVMRENIKLVEGQLQEAQELNLLGSWEYDLNTKDLSISQSALKVIGWIEKETSPNIVDYIRQIHPEDLTLHLDGINAAMNLQEEQKYDVRILLPNDSIRYIQIIVKPIISLSGQVIKLFGTVQDINLRKLNEQALILAKDQAEQATRSKSLFLGNVSHEMRTPLNAIIGLSELAVEEQDAESRKEQLISVIISGKNLLKTINEILDFSKIEAQKLHLELSSFSLRVLVRNLYQSFSLRYKESKTDFLLQYDDRIPEFLVGDSFRLNQVLLNLVGNAFKFTEKGKVELRFLLTEDSGDQASIRFIVSDTGIGIVPEKQKEIFDSFSQADLGHTRKFGGTGLGLSISRSLVELMGGHIEISSVPGVGTIFEFVLNFPKAMKAAEENDLVRFDPEDVSGLRILVAEDNTMNQYVIKQLLRKWNLQPDIAENGIHALEKLSHGAYDVVLMDLHMPEMDGFEATERFRSGNMYARNNHVPVIAVSADGFASTQKRAFDCGMNGFITKPVQRNVLFQVLKSVANKTISFQSLSVKDKQSLQKERLSSLAMNDVELYKEIVSLYEMEIRLACSLLIDKPHQANLSSIVQVCKRINHIADHLNYPELKKLLMQVGQLESISGLDESTHDAIIKGLQDVLADLTFIKTEINSTSVI